MVKAYLAGTYHAIVKSLALFQLRTSIDTEYMRGNGVLQGWRGRHKGKRGAETDLWAIEAVHAEYFLSTLFEYGFTTALELVQ